MPKPKLNLCAAEWTFTGHPSESDERSMDRKTQEAKEAGFAGFSAGPSPTTVQACQKSGLTLVGMVDIGSIEEVKAKLDRLRDTGCVHVNVQLCDHDTPTSEAVEVALAAIQYGESMGLKPAIEWHRDTATETPEKGLALIDEYKRRYDKTLCVNFD